MKGFPRRRSCTQNERTHAISRFIPQYLKPGGRDPTHRTGRAFRPRHGDGGRLHHRAVRNAALQDPNLSNDRAAQPTIIPGGVYGQPGHQCDPSYPTVCIPAAMYDAYSVSNALDLADDMRREESRAPMLPASC